MAARVWGIGVGIVVAALWLAPTGASAASRLASSDLEQSPAEVRDYWTEERMENAIPLDLGAAPVPEVVPGLESLRDYDAAGGKPRVIRQVRAAAAYAATPVADPSAAGTRTHGKIFASNPSFDYVCSGTVVNSPNRSTVWTAAHCIYDPDSNQFATALLFVPAYNEGAAPFTAWAARDAFVPSRWPQFEENIDDVGAALMEVKQRAKTASEKRACNRIKKKKKRKRCKQRPVPAPIQDVVGGRGIAFNQDPFSYTYSAFGYPASPEPRFDGESMELCVSPVTQVDNSVGPPPPIGIECDMQGGSSGGGWVISGSVVNGNVSYGYPTLDPNTFYSPYYDSFIQQFYEAIRNLN